MVSAPVAIAFDENGRLFVVERHDLSGAAELSSHMGRIRLLENPDTNGVYQSSVVYADNVPWASALACYSGGIFVAAGSDILYFKDTKNAGAADVRQTVLSGFGGTNSFSTESLLNNFNWGLDNRIHGATAGIGGLIVASNAPSGPVSLDGSDFSLDPLRLELSAESGPAQSGVSFDSRGRKFVSDFARPLRRSMYDLRYGVRNPFYAKAPELTNVVNAATSVYRYAINGNPSLATGRPAQNERRSVNGTNALTSAWLSYARGFVVYRGGAFPSNYLESVFIAAPELHLVHHIVLREDGLVTTAERPPDESTKEFLASTDSSFRPVQLVNGPDGTLYVVDTADGNEQGRIYRIAPENFRAPKPPQLGNAKSFDLVRTLAQGDGWHRDTAARLLCERHDPSAVGLLTELINHSRLPLAKVRALHVLDTVQALREAHVLTALTDGDPLVREHAVLVSERLAQNGAISDALWNQLASLAADPFIQVRYQLALTVGNLQRANRTAVLARVLSRDPREPWIQNAVLSSVPDGGGTLFTLLASDARFRSDVVGLEFLRQLATMIGAQGRMNEVTRIMDFIARDQLNVGQAFALVYSLGEGLHRTKSSLALVDPQLKLQRWYTAAFNTAIDSFASEAARVEGINLLGVGPYRFIDISDWLLLLCAPPPAPPLQSAALTALGRFDEPLVLQGLSERWQGLTPALRNQAVTVLLSRESRVPALLETIAAGRIPIADLSPWHLNFLRTYRDPAVSQRAVQLFGPVTTSRPSSESRFRPALQLQGTAERGRVVFRVRCVQCHQFAGEGQPFGPELTSARTASREHILAAILEPNLNVSTEYSTWVLLTKEGENLIGIKAEDDLPTVTLHQPGGRQLVWPRLNVRSAENLNWSLMPEGLEQGLSTQDMADLLEYMMTGAR